jgi:putative DNA methylase
MILFSSQGFLNVRTSQILHESKKFHKILRDDGVLTVMFNRKSNDAWNMLGQGLIEASFEITVTWPVSTGRKQSLHQANKVWASGTILFVCR